MEKKLIHIGTLHRSGRYPWGSGENPNQRNTSFRGNVKALRKKGLSDNEIAKGFGMNSSQFRKKISITKDEDAARIGSEVNKLKAKGMSNVAIGKQLNMPEPTVRSYLNSDIKEKTSITRNIANLLKDEVDKYKYVDVGLGVEQHIGITRTRLKTAISMTEGEGYRIHKFDTPQLGTDKPTNMMVLTKDDMVYDENGKGHSKLYGELIKNRDQIHLINHYSEDGGRTLLGIEPIKHVDSKRIKIQYHEDGGSQKDGVIELRRGVDELSLGSKKYAQVRIGVDGTHYLKGMAMYADTLPKGIDILYNTNKHAGTPKEEVFKKLEKDVDNPFKSTIRQKHYIDKNGKEQLSALNMVGSPTKEDSGEEGSWGKWSKNLSSQILSKQSPALAKKQLGLTYDAKKEEYDEIISLTQPTVRKKLLASLADDCDASAVHLKAAALPRQMSHIILPIPDMKETEVYAPNYDNGETVVLIRHPHGGLFEIPELTVNNNQRTAKKLLGGNPPVEDAIGIHPKVAERLSGADFDGDTVLVIPNKKGRPGSIKTQGALKGLVDFDPKEDYRPYDGLETIDGGVWNAKTNSVDYGGKPPNKAIKQRKMGDVSNLITDMTIKGADPDTEIVRAVRHSMVVIDSEKHSLDYKRSYIDNGIASLKIKYQGGPNKGASTLISKADSQKPMPHREEGKKVINPITGKTKRVYIDPETGRKLYEYKEESYKIYKDSVTGKPYSLKGKTAVERDALLKEGIIKEKIVKKQTMSTKMNETEDAFTLSSGTIIEGVYANHANRLKALANQARKETLKPIPTNWSPSAKEVYAPEVKSLKAKLEIATWNKPLERQAHLLGFTIVRTKKLDNPGMTKEELKKVKGQALMEARNRAGAKKKQIDISDKEWEAIQTGAISNSLLTQILQNADLNKVKQLATPKTTTTITPAKLALAKALFASGNTTADVANRLGVSTSKLLKELK